MAESTIWPPSSHWRACREDLPHPRYPLANYFSISPPPPLHSWVTGSGWHMASPLIDELWPSGLTLCCYFTSHVLQHSCPPSAALKEMKNMAQSKWFTSVLTQHIDYSKLLNASPEGCSVSYCTTISKATGLSLQYTIALIKRLHWQDAFVLPTLISNRSLAREQLVLYSVLWMCSALNLHLIRALACSCFNHSFFFVFVECVNIQNIIFCM